MHNRVLRAFQRFKGPRNQFRTALNQHLQRYIIRHIAFLDAPAGEVEIRLGSRWEANLDLLEAHVEQQREHACLAVMAHGINQRLVAVAQIDRAPDRCLFDALRWPRAICNVYKRIGLILAAGIRHPRASILGILVLHVHLALLLAGVLTRVSKSCNSFDDSMKEPYDTGVRSPGAPSADPAIADKAGVKRRKQERSRGSTCSSRRKSIYAILNSHGNLIAKRNGRRKCFQSSSKA